MISDFLIRLLYALFFVQLMLPLYGQKLEVEGDIDVRNNQIKNLADPTDPQDAITKNYLLNFGISLVGIQGMLDAGYDPFDLLAAGISKDSLYGMMYQGGLIFYLDDHDTVPSIKGMVAAPPGWDGINNPDPTPEWGCDGIDLPDVPNVAVDPPVGPGARIGDGISNTTEILVNCPSSPVALACTGYMGGGFADWFVPSVAELKEIYFNLHLNGFGEFITNVYWSSTEVSSTNVWTMYFGDGDQISGSKFNFFISVRPVRTF